MSINFYTKINPTVPHLESKHSMFLYLFLGIAQIRNSSGALGSATMTSPQTIRGRLLHTSACDCNLFSWAPITGNIICRDCI